MRQFSLLLILFMGLSVFSFAQPGFDVTKVLADPNTQVFNDGKHTVNSYLYSALESESACCGNDAIYLEVKIDQQGYVTGAKTLTGKNDCYRKSITDAIKNVRWIHEDIRGTRTIYFEVKPVVPCEGSPNENDYTPIVVFNNPYFGDGGAVATNEGAEETSSGNDLLSDNEGAEEASSTVEETMETVEETVEETMEETEEVIADVEETVEETTEAVEETTSDPFAEEGFLTEESFTSNETVEESTSNEETSLLDAKTKNWTNDTEETESTSEPEESFPTEAVVKTVKTQPRRNTGKISIPPQSKKTYNPIDHKPNESHNTTFANVQPKTAGKTVNFTNQDGIALEIKKGLRAKGICGLANVLAEVTVSPNGDVVSHRVLQTNSEDITSHLPEVLSTIKLESRDIRYNYPVLVQFKTDILCKDDQKPVDLKGTNYYLNTEGID